MVNLGRPSTIEIWRLFSQSNTLCLYSKIDISREENCGSKGGFKVGIQTGTIVWIISGNGDDNSRIICLNLP